MDDFYIINWDKISSFSFEKNNIYTAISIGGFDGIHIGHKALLNHLEGKAEEYKLKKGIVTFSFPPSYCLGHSSLGPISSIRLKKEKIRKLGFDFMVLVDFSLDFAKMTGKHFIALLKKHLNLRYLLVGKDFRFGVGRSSSIDDMASYSKEFSFEFEVFDPVLVNGDEKKISSSLIRQALYDGNLSLVASFLGEAFVIDVLGLSVEKLEQNSVFIRRKDVIQVLPKECNTIGVVSFLNNFSDKEANIIINDEYIRILFKDYDIQETYPYLDIVKIK